MARQRCKACQYDREKPKLEPGHAGRAEDVEVEEDDSDDGSEPSNPYDEGSSIWATVGFVSPPADLPR
jgi:hypothetical protein